MFRLKKFSTIRWTEYDLFYIWKSQSCLKIQAAKKGVKIQASKGATSSLAKGFQSSPRRPKGRG